jgi:hypothetical protein
MLQTPSLRQGLVRRHAPCRISTGRGILELPLLRRRRIGARLRDRCRRQGARRLNDVLRGDSAHEVVHLGGGGGR